MATVSKTMHYKRAKAESDSQNLQNVLEQVYNSKTCQTAHGRLFAVGGEIRVINYHGIAFNTMQVGTFVSFEPGQSAYAVINTPGKDILNIAALPPEDHSAFLQSTLYFGIRGNDVVIIPSGRLNVEAFEEYLQWIIQEQAQIDTNVVLSDYPATKRQENVRYLELSAQAGVTTSNGTLFIVGPAYGLLSSMIFDGDAILPNKLCTDSIITAKIHLTVTKRPRLEEGEFDFLDDLADYFRNQVSTPGINCTIETHQGMMFSDTKNFRFAKTFSCACTDKNALYPDAVWEAMYQWLTAIDKLS